MSGSNDSIAIDTGALVELLGKTSLGSKFKDLVLKDPAYRQFHVSPITVMELLYLSGRTAGFSNAREKVNEFIKPFIVCDERVLRVEAARVKTTLPIALADCYSIALGLVMDMPVYMKREAEIDAIFQKGPFPFPVDIRFIDDLAARDDLEKEG